VRINHEIVPWGSAIDRSFQVPGQGALVSEAMKKPVIHSDALADLSDGFPLSHFPEVLSFVLIERRFVIGQGPASFNKRQRERHPRVLVFIGR